MIRMPFGRHQGQPLADIPGPYLRWVLAQCRNAGENLRRAIKAELNRRDDPGPARHSAYQAARDREPLDGLTGEELEIRMIRLLLAAERSGDFSPGELLDALWDHMAVAFNMLHRQPASKPRSVREPIELAKRAERN